MSHDESGIRLGIDTGGTFTDVITGGADGELEVYKLLSTPEDPSRAIGDGVAAVLERDTVCREIIHGTTVATNALLERQGATVAFVTTAGFEDLLWMRRQARPELYALEVRLDPPLVEEGYCFGVDERLDAQGQVIRELDDAEVHRLVEAVASVNPDAVVVCLLHAYANETHERRLTAALKAHSPSWHVTGSCEITATFREYERASTATINGFVGPVMERYLERLDERLDTVERLEVLQSHGGRADAAQAARLPVHTVLSGPAGGVVGALQAAKELAIDRIISFDMGGTSTDVSLADGEPTLTEEARIGGFPLQVPVIDIHTVGAGGGSIAHVDAGGAMRVGPRSAGADPGPAAYDRGGDAPTVTDAHVVLGSLRPHRFLGGAMELKRQRSLEVIQTLGEQLGTEPAATARGILEIADAAMARAIKVISLERGHDPRDYTLVAFGGAGGLHACRLAAMLDMRQVLVPQCPGLLSAVGMLRSDARRLYSQTVLTPLKKALKGDGAAGLRKMMETFEERALQQMGEPAPQLVWTASFRYEGQSFAIPLEVDWRSQASSWQDPSERFEREHDRLYGYRASGRAIELVDLRLQARRSVGNWSVEPVDDGGNTGERHGQPADSATIDLGDGPQSVRVVERADLAEGSALSGPAVITEYSGTTVILDSWTATVANGHLLIQGSDQ